MSQPFKDDSSSTSLKPDHPIRPIYVSNDGRIVLEAFSPIADRVSDFLIAVAEPVSRPHHIHEYRMTEYSLYAAVSVGLNTKSILDVLERLSKTTLPPAVITFVRKYTSTYGKVKLVQKANSRFFVESSEQQVLRKLLEDEAVRSARIPFPTEDGPASVDADGFLVEVAPSSNLFRSKRKRKDAATKEGNKRKKTSENEANGSDHAGPGRADQTSGAGASSSHPVAASTAEPVIPSVDEIDLFDMFDSADVPARPIVPSAPAPVTRRPASPDPDSAAADASKQITNPEEESMLGALISIDEQDENDAEFDDDVGDSQASQGRKEKFVLSFEIFTDKVEEVKKQCSQLK
ncbi:hypothetical protein HDU96_006184 [Phlyctochytrium bullatum]|nr:hypothetical protein HDU96_006184 [Phlyctochytrium bullatum]